MEDILETLLGLEIMDESDSVEDLAAFGTLQIGMKRAKRLGNYSGKREGINGNRICKPLHWENSKNWSDENGITFLSPFW